MIELVVVVGLMALLASFTALSINHGPDQKTIEEAGRQLSRYLKSLATEASSSGRMITLNVNVDQGDFYHEGAEHTSRLLNRLDLPEGIRISQMVGAEGTDFLEDSDIVEIEISPKGLKESMQFHLNHQDLRNVIVTWKLRGQICSVETEKEGVEFEHWKDEVVRF